MEEERVECDILREGQPDPFRVEDPIDVLLVRRAWTGGKGSQDAMIWSEDVPARSCSR